MFATKLEQYGEKLKRQAREEALKEGREQNAVRVARRLLARGESVSAVAEITELSEERVLQLRGENDTR